MKRPVVDLSDCIQCGVCVDVCPDVFIMRDAGYIDVLELDTYPVALVDVAIQSCPTDCIHWHSD